MTPFSPVNTLLLILCAFEREADPLRKRFRREWEEIGGLRGFRAPGFVVALTGVGMERARKAAAMMLPGFRPDAVLSTGYCGAVHPELSAGDLVVSTEIADMRKGTAFRPAHALLRMALEAAEAVGLRAVARRTATVERVVTGAEERKRLRRDGFHAVDMESAALAAGAEGAGVRFLCVRAVSDTFEEGIPPVIVRIKRGEASPFRALRPDVVRAALRLRRHSSRASINLALFIEAFAARVGGRAS